MVNGPNGGSGLGAIALRLGWGECSNQGGDCYKLAKTLKFDQNFQ